MKWNILKVNKILFLTTFLNIVITLGMTTVGKTSLIET